VSDEEDAAAANLTSAASVGEQSNFVLAVTGERLLNSSSCVRLLVLSLHTCSLCRDSLACVLTSTDDGWNATAVATYVGLTRVLCRLPADSPYRFNVSLPAAADVVTPSTVLFAFSPYANTTIQQVISMISANLTVRRSPFAPRQDRLLTMRAGDRLHSSSHDRNVQRDMRGGAGDWHGDQQQHCRVPVRLSLTQHQLHGFGRVAGLTVRRIVPWRGRAWYDLCKCVTVVRVNRLQYRLCCMR
jgi:hypothetical protein